MDMVALVAGVGEFYFLGFKMLGHGNGFNHCLGSGLDFCVVAAKTQGGDFSVFFHWQSAGFFTVADMIGIGAVAEFAGDGVVAALEVDGRLIGMTFKAGCIGAVADGSLNLFVNGICPVMAIFPKGIWNELGLYHKSDTRGHNKGSGHCNQSKRIVGHIDFSLPAIHDFLEDQTTNGQVCAG